MTHPVLNPGGDIEVHPTQDLAPRSEGHGVIGVPALYHPHATYPVGWEAPVGRWPMPGGDTHFHLHYHAAPTLTRPPAELGNQPVVHHYVSAPRWTPPAVVLTFLIAMVTAVILAWFSIQALDWLIESFIHAVGG